MKRIAILTLLILSAITVFGQAVRVDIPIQTTGPNVPSGIGPLPQALWIANAGVNICTHPSASLAACIASPVTTYTDSTKGTTCPPATPLVQLPGNTCTASTGVASTIGFWYGGGTFDYWITASYGSFGPFTVTSPNFCNPGGCTITGPIFGTDATFSGTVVANTANVSSLLSPTSKGTSIGNQIYGSTYNGLAAFEPVVIDGNYNAFPGISYTTLANGNMIVVYRKGTTHASDAGTIVKQISTDNGHTWGVQSLVYSAGSLDARDPGLKLLSDGSLIMSFFVSTVGGFPTGTFVLKSFDGGTTWGSPINVGGSSAWEACSSPVIQLANGSLLLALYSLSPSNTDSTATIQIVSSTDAGVSWSNGAVVSTINGVTEPNLILTQTGSILAMIRNELTDFAMVAKSTDSGATWGTAVNVFPANSKISIGQFGDGTFLAMYKSWDTVTTGGVLHGQGAVRISLDPNALSWSSPELLLTTDNDTLVSYVYGNFVQITPQMFGAVYCMQFTAATSGCYFRYLDKAYLSAPQMTANVNGFVSRSFGYVDGNLWLTGNPGSRRYIGLDADSTLNSALAIQAGFGSSGSGGAIILYGHSASSHAGSIQLGISNGSGGNVCINSNADGSGTDVFCFNAAGHVHSTGTNALADYGITDGMNLLADNFINPATRRWLGLNQGAAGTGILNFQAGDGSAFHGGGLILYGHSESPFGGWVKAGIDTGVAGAKFCVNGQADGAGTDVACTDGIGNTVTNGSMTVGGESAQTTFLACYTNGGKLGHCGSVPSGTPPTCGCVSP
jgi:hypothetical protein